VAAAVLVAAAAAFVLPRIRARRQAQARTAAAAQAVARAPRRAIAVLGFRNLAGRPADAWISTALSEMLTTELAAGEKLRAVPGESVARMRVDLSLPDADTLATDTLARVKQNIGADVVLLGSYLVLGEETGAPIRLDLRLQETGSGETIAVVSEKGAGAELDALVGRAGARLREKLELPAVSRAQAAAVKAALPVERRRRAPVRAGPREAPRVRRHLRARAARAGRRRRADARARALGARAGVVQPGLRREGARRGRARHERAGKLSRETRLLIEGRYRAMNDQWDRAVEIYQSLFTFYPDDVDYGLILANAQTRAGTPTTRWRRSRAAQVVCARRRAVRARGGGDGARAVRLPARGEGCDARGGDRLGAGARLGVASALLLEASARRNLGHAKEAMEPAEAARRLFDAAGDQAGVAAALNHLGNSQADLGDLAAARKSYEGVLDVARRIGARRWPPARSTTSRRSSATRATSSRPGACPTRRSRSTARSATGGRGDDAQQHRRRAHLGRRPRGRARGLPARDPDLPRGRRSGGLAIALNNIGEMQANQGDVRVAEKSFDESERIFRESGQKSKAVYPMVGLAAFASRPATSPARRSCSRTRPSCVAPRRTSTSSPTPSPVSARSRRRRIGSPTRARGSRRRAGSARSSARRERRPRAARPRAALARRGRRRRGAGRRARGGGRVQETAVADDEASAGPSRPSPRRGSSARTTRRELERARVASERSQHDGVRRDLLLATAAVQAARGQAESARRSLRNAADRARENGLETYALQARFLVLQIGIAAGGPASRRRRPTPSRRTRAPRLRAHRSRRGGGRERGRRLAWCRSRAGEMERLLRELVEIESPSTDPAAVAALARRVAGELEPLGLDVELVPADGHWPVLRARRRSARRE
jgi:tetratricopeptide (TPR) repeat protein/TolB-like protein